MTGLHYPDNLYADHEERKARRSQQPTGAYRSTEPEMPESERKLRTALAYVCHARDLIRDVLGDNDPKAQRDAKIAYDMASDSPVPERIPKWDPKWAESCPQRAHPMNAEVIRDHDERLAGGEDRL
jgi:hypothetical protein